MEDDKIKKAKRTTVQDTLKQEPQILEQHKSDFGDIVEFDSTPKEVEKVQIQIPIKKVNQNLNPPINKNVTSSLNSESKKKYETGRIEENIFDESGNYYEEENELNKAVSGLKHLIDNNLKSFLTLIQNKVINKTSSTYNKILVKSIAPKIKKLSQIIEMFARYFNKNKSQTIEIIEEIEQKEPEYILSSFNKARSLNIMFTDNYDVNFYVPLKKDPQALSSQQESLVMQLAVLSIKECAPLTKAMEAPKEGMFKDREVSDIMINVVENDILLFLGYVTKSPKKYIGNNWKISETYATWILNNAPLKTKS